MFAILRSIRLKEIRARKMREGGGFVDADDALSIDGAQAIETKYSRRPSVKREWPVAGSAAADRVASMRKVTAMLIPMARLAFRSARS
jgi:hypothetical protein